MRTVEDAIRTVEDAIRTVEDAIRTVEDACPYRRNAREDAFPIFGAYGYKICADPVIIKALESW